ncbi:MAG TPA: alginate lyase family protein [Gaiellaceae bacterium]|nr:alginate lyase family protein [Gaiellaceae bacterium]
MSVAAPSRSVLAPRPLYCAIEHLHRDRRVADAVRAGRFTHCGITLALGSQPNWVAAPVPEDEEWRIEWVKFYYGLDLAHAFRETADAGYLEAWERLVRSWLEQVPPDHDPSEVAARRIQNWLYAWGSFGESPAFRGLTPRLGEQLLASLAAQAAHVRATLTAERNHRTLELYALFLLPLAFTDLDEDGLLEFAVDALRRDLLDAFRADGAHRESSTHYHLVALRTFVAARANAARFGIDLGSEYDERLSRACDFALHVQRPDGRIPALSDSDSESYGELLSLAARLLRRRDLAWAASAGGAGEPPPARNVSFPDGGYFVQRSGWGDGEAAFRDERFLVFDCGPLGDGGHGHYDLLSVEAYGAGRPLVVDPGRYTYSEHGGNLRRRFKGTAAHNTVCVDGLDQTPYRRGKPRGPVADGRLLRRLRSPGLDVLVGEARSPVYEAVHVRTVAFVAGEYWVIDDRLRGDRRHRYDLRFQLACGPAEAEGDTVRAPGLTLVVAADAGPRLEEGWVSERYGEKRSAPMVSVSVDGLAARFVTVLYPGDAPLSVRARGTVVEVGMGDRVDRLLLTPERATWERRP